MAEINLRLSAAQAKAMLDLREAPCYRRRTARRRAAEFRLREAIFEAYPQFRAAENKGESE